MMLKFCEIIIIATSLSFAGVQVCVSSPPLSTCARIPSGGCRFNDPSVRCPSDCSYFFDAVETALVNDTSALYTLQRAFFPDGEQKPVVVDIYVTLIVEQAVDLPCDNELVGSVNLASLGEQNDIVTNICANATGTKFINCSRRQYRWHHVWTGAVLTNVIERESLGLISSINSVAFVTLLYSESQTSVIVATNSEQRDFQPREAAFIELTIPSLPCLPSEPEVTLKDAWEEILPWIHVYTLRRRRISFSDGERAFTFEDSNLDSNSELIFGTFQRREVEENIFITYLTAMHILLQVAAGLTVMKLVPSYYSSISKGARGKQKNSSSISIFWANVLFAVVIDLLFVCLDLYLIVKVYRGVDGALRAIANINRTSLQNAFVFGMLGTVVTFILLVLQFIIAVGIPKNTTLYTPGFLKLFGCFFFCRCTFRKVKFSDDLWPKALQTIAVWSLMAFIQFVAGSVIPYLVLAIVNPVPSVTFLALGASTLFCLVIFVASLIQVGGHLRKTTCYEKLVAVVQGLVFIVFLGLVAITVIIYQGVIQSGTSTGPLTGIALSLVPSGIIAVFGVAVKWKVLSDVDEENPKQQGTLITRATSLIRNKVPTKQPAPGTENQQESLLSRATSLIRNNILTKEPSTEDQKEDILSTYSRLPVSNGLPKKGIVETVNSNSSGDDVETEAAADSNTVTEESNFENPTGDLSDVFVNENADSEEQVVSIDFDGSDEKDTSSNVQDCPA